MRGLQPRWADSHSELGRGPGELPTALSGARGEAGPWQQGPERVHGESPLCLPLSHSFPKNVPRVYPLGVEGWQAAPSGPPPQCLPGSPTLLLPQEVPALMTPCQPSLDAGVHLDGCLLSKY